MLETKLAVALLALVALLAPSTSRADTATVASFESPNLPEGLAVDSTAAVYVGFAPTGEIRRIGPDGGQSTLATLRPGLGSLLGLAVDGQGNVLAALASQNTPGSDAHGVWRVAPSGATALVAAFPATTMPNALAFGPKGALFVSDSMRGSIWRIGPDGQASQWLKDELLKGDLQACPPPVVAGPVGANGLAFEASGSLLVANTTKGQIVRVPINADESPGTPAVAFGPSCQMLAGADGIALDGAGNLFVAVNLQDRLVRIGPAGDMETVATKADGLDFPASLAFDRGRLLLTNYAQLSFLNRLSRQPSLFQLDGR